MERVFRYFPSLSLLQKQQLEALLPLYQEWNSKINVLSRKEDSQEWPVRHLLHSLSLAKMLQFKPGCQVMDVGTGGGFPGIPLAILFPQSQFYLIDSIGKKVKVVQSVSESIGLKNVQAQQIRAEQVKTSFDFVVSRAVTALPELYEWIRKAIKKESMHEIPNGLICLKGGDLKEELAPFASKGNLQNIPISRFFDDPFFETKKIIYLPIT